jgi:pimeloyl-ACP methyl ester carboxylesterase
VRAAHPERAAAIADCVRSSERRGLAVAVRSAMLDRPSLVARLPSVRVPTLFITGGADSLYPVPLARVHAEAIPGARFEVIAGSAHQSGLERPDEVNHLIDDFIAGLAP